RRADRPDRAPDRDRPRSEGAPARPRARQRRLPAGRGRRRRTAHASARSAQSVGTLIDTSVLIAAERGRLDPDALQRENDDEEIAIAAITASELLHGVHRLAGAVARTRAERFVERILAVIPVIAFDLDVARVHARLDAELSAQ